MSMPYSTYSYDFGICAIFQNEAPYLREWIEYHKIVGAQHFYLYNNLSQDNFLQILQPYLNSGIVELVDWSMPEFQSYGQRMAYMDAIDKARGNIKWLAIIDIDEYLVPKANNTIPEFLSQFEKEGIGGVGINWQMFGTSFIPNITENQLLTELLTLKAREDHEENEHIKSIVRPEYVIEPPGVHNFTYREGYHQVNPNQEHFTGPIAPYIATDKIQINHYWAKDEAFFNSIKIPRRLNWGESMENIEHRLNALNKIKDTSIEPYLPKLRQNMFALSEEMAFSSLNENWISRQSEMDAAFNMEEPEEILACNETSADLDHFKNVRESLSASERHSKSCTIAEPKAPIKDLLTNAFENKTNSAAEVVNEAGSLIANKEILVADNHRPKKSFVTIEGALVSCLILIIIAACLLTPKAIKKLKA